MCVKHGNGVHVRHSFSLFDSNVSTLAESQTIKESLEPKLNVCDSIKN